MAVDQISYSTVTDADTYFATKLYTTEWDLASNDDKQKALNDANRIIEQFAYLGTPTTERVWPRANIVLEGTLLDENTIPDDIYNAEREIANSLIKGFDPEREIRSLRVTSRGYSSARITYDSKQIPEHLALGVPSMLGWSYLLPYLERDSFGVIKLHRVS